MITSTVPSITARHALSEPTTRRSQILPRARSPFRATREAIAVAVLSLSAATVLTRPAGAQTDTTGAFRFEAEVRLVRVTASVTDRKGVPVRGLGRENFRVFENGQPQEMADFRVEENAPISVVLLLDTSGSMIDKLDEATDALIHFAATMSPGSQFWLYEFNTVPNLLQDATSNRLLIARALPKDHAGGGTAIYDAIAQGIETLRDVRDQRAAILLVTDGNDNSSRMPFAAVRRMLQSSNVLLYAIGIGHSDRGSFGHGYLAPSEDEVNGDTLNALTGDVGGRTIIVKGAHREKGKDVLDDAAMQIADELQYQYVLTYVPSADPAPGEWRSITVKVPNGDLRVRARSGYRSAAP